MINIDIFTLGNEFKDDNGNIWKVVDNNSLGNTDRFTVDFQKVEPAFNDKLVDE